MNSLLFPIAIFVPLFISSIQCLDLESAKEQPCFKIENTLPFMSNSWTSDIETTYYPLMSRLDLYHATVDILQKDPTEISESEVYYDACIAWKSNNGTYHSEGFGGKTREYTVNYKGNDLEEYTLRPQKGEGYKGTFYVTYTDHKTFYFAASCLDDGQMTWGVGSSTPTLPQETVKLIHEHALSLGFKKEFFSELRYDSCHMQNEI
ncbi:hypothetical protein Ocin01_13350 [Orchesella cincta]|uniref:Uncharacterized protein n=1 Tax=Orchesella cincta TaxID=48709 RepID=A0A1D2MKA2_ORCCI|nr:hypothetical protein Ocin01_13350 [Orchesella cincta]